MIAINDCIDVYVARGLFRLLRPYPTDTVDTHTAGDPSSTAAECKRAGCEVLRRSVLCETALFCMALN